MIPSPPRTIHNTSSSRPHALRSHERSSSTLTTAFERSTALSSVARRAPELFHVLALFARALKLGALSLCFGSRRAQRQEVVHSSPPASATPGAPSRARQFIAEDLHEAKVQHVARYSDNPPSHGTLVASRSRHGEFESSKLRERQQHVKRAYKMRCRSSARSTRWTRPKTSATPVLVTQINLVFAR
ncbi:hypothetical protein EXIGLDRAFT_782057 [Exidia glandulosa HHB12029]|uniref:Uncharacterized protein n=1 Tax=Exidia glandulosa HHB12029 TaxID=1314781 RepID=A0A165B0T2_EXIGL|nr:hypothetical protein EXIGLDRAFT_782057 [Exidia glandulosa HHB12029]